ncbi:MAG: DNA replication/repair protein RecF [Clostridia bacterium]|nr:DNA replication/repair protein RecF [Clostridia bacterium]
MKIKSLFLSNWRNIEEIHLDFAPGVQLILGKNAQGKTNILEALSMASTMRSFRTSKEQMLIRSGEKTAKITLVFEKNGREQTLKIDLTDGAPKRVFLDGRHITRTRDAIGLFCSVLFTPDHLMMIKGSPGERREFLDLALCAASPRYTEDLLQYNKALKNRNRLLKSENEALLATLPVWDDTLCRYGARIAESRAKYIEKLSAAAAAEYAQISAGGEKMKLVYINQFAKEAKTAEEYYALMMEQLEKKRERDIENQSTGMGVHKDDFLTLLSGKSAKFFGSQGQIRSCVLSIKMAEAALIKEQSGLSPVILLDDILSELDEERQQYILEHTFENQCVVTACEPDKLRRFTEGSIYIKGGKTDVSPFRG